jgi:hypothetical protein
MHPLSSFTHKCLSRVASGKAKKDAGQATTRSQKAAATHQSEACPVVEVTAVMRALGPATVERAALSASLAHSVWSRSSKVPAWVIRL